MHPAAEKTLSISEPPRQSKPSKLLMATEGFGALKMVGDFMRISWEIREVTMACFSYQVGKLLLAPTGRPHREFVYSVSSSPLPSNHWIVHGKSEKLQNKNMVFTMVFPSNMGLSCKVRLQ